MPWSEECSFHAGAVRDDQRAYFALTKDSLARDKLAHALIAYWDGTGWDADTTPWRVSGVAVTHDPRTAAIFVGEWGGVSVWGDAGRPSEVAGPGGAERIQGPEDRGPLRGLRTIAGQVWAVGMDRQVYQRDRSGRWQVRAEEIRPEPGTLAVVGFEAIDGFGPNDLYAVGWGGEIAYYNGQTWRLLDSPTNVILNDVCCAPDGQVYAVGRLGKLLRGRGDTWEILPQDLPPLDLYSVAWFEEKLHVGGLTMLLTLDEAKLKPYVFADELPGSFNKLAGGFGKLWSIGPKDLFVTAEESWTRID